MAIPKYITHPLILAGLSAGLGFILWLKTPTLDPKGLTTADYEQILDLNEDGCLVLKETPKVCFNPQYTEIKGLNTLKLKDFLTSKWILKSTLKQPVLNLPLELFVSECFDLKKSPDFRGYCPVILNP